MVYYYITKRKSKDKHAGGKAPNDIDAICSKRGWNRLVYPDFTKNKHLFYKRALRTIGIKIFWVKLSLSIKRDSVVFYQHPMRCGSKIAAQYINRLQAKKNIKFVVLIHDIDSIRYSHLEDSRLNEDKLLLKLFDVLICHNDHMKAYLESQGIPSDSIVTLKVFDYLVKTNKTNDTANGLTVAGNLSKEKCKYIYDMASITSDLDFYAYGVNFDEEDKPSNLFYQGSYAPDELPTILKGHFGVIWDGDSIDNCTGDFGEYMRYNNPHKLSLYIAAGKLVICWKQAAIADFVISNKIGIAVESLADAVNTVESMDDSTYLEMKKNVMIIREKVISGYYFCHAADKAIHILNDNRKALPGSDER